MTTDIFEQKKLEEMTNRPHGVTIVAILMIINGIISLVGGVTWSHWRNRFWSTS